MGDLTKDNPSTESSVVDKVSDDKNVSSVLEDNKTESKNNTLEPKDKLMKQIKKPTGGKHPAALIIGSVLVVFAGIGTGWFLSDLGNTSAVDGDIKTSHEAVPGAIKTAMEAGFEDESLFEEDAPEGLLTEGGIEGEGTHYLDRGLGPEKDVYLTSTVLDLQSFVGKKVKVWGNTVAAQNAPWLMDVGKLKVVE